MGSAEVYLVNSVDVALGGVSIAAGVSDSDAVGVPAEARPRRTWSMRPVGVRSLDCPVYSPDPGAGAGVDMGGSGLAFPLPTIPVNLYSTKQ